MLFASAAMVCAQAVQAQPQGNRQPQPGGYAQPHSQPVAPRSYVGGGYPGANGPVIRNPGYPQARYAPQQGNSYPQPQRSYPQPGPYGQNSRYAQNGGYAQPQNGPQAPVAIPNRNANYTGNNQPMRQNPQQRFWQQQDGTGPNATRGEHLQQWMAHHNTLTTEDQQRALQREPGFNQLPQQTQQRMLDRLGRLNSMPAEQRERTLQRSEQMERLSPGQRGQVRSAMGELGALPQDRRRAVARSFRELRSLTPEQRNQVLNSPGYRQQFSDGERSTLNNLLTVSPMLPQQ